MNLKKSIFISLLVLASFLSYAQEAPPEGPPDGEIPIDGGISFLIVSGIAIGTKAWYNQTRKRKISQ